MKTPNEHLSIILKQIRKNKKISLDTTSKLTGVSKAMLGQIERGESSPTLSVLWKIATGLDISLTTLIEPMPTSSQTLVRNADEIRHRPTKEGMSIAALFPFDDTFNFEYMELILSSGYDRLSTSHAPGTVEIITIIEGELDVLSRNIWHSLKTGDSIRFAGDEPHRYRNKSKHPTKVINVIHYHSITDELVTFT